VVKRSSECLNQAIEEKTVAWAFDTLGYAKRLRDAGVPNPQAEAHAEAAREFIMTELLTKQDLLVIKQDLLATKQELQTAMDTLALRLTVQLGGIVVAGLGALALLIRLH
jgi:hypothetical protein